MLGSVLYHDDWLFSNLLFIREYPQFEATASRPSILLKTARTGSSWLSGALNLSGSYCAFTPEATNPIQKRYGEFEEGSDSCNQSLDLLSSMMYSSTNTHCQNHSTVGFGGYSLNPWKHSNVKPNSATGLSCMDHILKMWTHYKPRPLVITLTRQNVVAQAISHLKSKHIKEAWEGLVQLYPGQPKGCGPFHLDQCSSEFGVVNLTILPKEFLNLVLSTAKRSKALQRLATQISDTRGDLARASKNSSRESGEDEEVENCPCCTFALTTEDMFAAGSNGSFGIPRALGKCINGSNATGGSPQFEEAFGPHGTLLPQAISRKQAFKIADTVCKRANQRSVEGVDRAASAPSC